MFRSLRKKLRTYLKNREKAKQTAEKARSKEAARQKAAAEHLEQRRRDLASQIAAAQPLRIVVGSSGVFEGGWIPTDIDLLNLLNESDWAALFGRRTIDAILAEHVWEHLTEEQGLLAAQHCHRFLRPGGRLRIAIPDGLHPDPAYIEHVRVGGSGPGADDHKVLHTWKTLSAMLQKAGFKAQLLEYWDESAQFHHTDWSPEDGMIHRSRRFDPRNTDGALRYTSLIIDGIKS